MSKEKLKYVNVNELQSNISKIVKDVHSGCVYKVMRYSEPQAVVISNHDYEKIQAHLQELEGSCRKCVMKQSKR
jgi:PHD/YefM family antitoxin component YafN of YafNO toxin-antitoxin module